MRVWNQTGFCHEFSMAMDKEAREYLLLVVKATYDFPEAPGARPHLSAEQTPLVMADIATGAPGYSATLWETDFAFRKARCDVVASAAAYAPGGRPAERVRIGLRVGVWSKSFEVIGAREWRALGSLFTATAPMPFLRRPFSYDTAFGGTDRLDPDDPLPASYARNPVGTGWSRPRNQSRIPGLALPSTQALGEEVTSPFGDYAPMSLGPVGRGWPGRIEHAGTYDAHWTEAVFPFLPPDFDERYYQMAPPDQWTDPPRAGDPVTLVNLTPRGREEFRLPDTALALTLFKGRVKAHEGYRLPDTLAFDCERRRFSLVWRLSARIERTILDFSEAWVGPPTPAMLRARAAGRDYIRAAGAPEDA